MSKADLFLFLATFGFFFLLCVALMIHVNHNLMKSADTRLSKANEMVLTLAHSADKLAESISVHKELLVQLQEDYNEKVRSIEVNRDDFRNAYTKLLAKYQLNEEKRDSLNKQYIDTLRSLAERPTITNTHNTTELS